MLRTRHKNNKLSEARTLALEGTAARTRRYSTRRRERGETRVAVWVPESRVGDLKSYAAKLRAEEESG